MTKPLKLSLAFVVALTLVAAWAAHKYYGEIDLGDKTVSIIIESGDSFDTVVDKIVSGGVVKSRLFLRYPARLMGIDRRLTPGRYDFTGSNTCRSVLRKLDMAEFVRIKVTIPEGAPIWQVASILSARLDIDSSEVIGFNRDSSYLATVALPGLEGYLFPETYFFPWGTGASEALSEMIHMFRAQTDTLWPEPVPLGLSRHDIIKLASIVEAETNLDSEYVLVASVYSNRLRKRMKLDADPTVIYGLGGLDRPLYRRDLRKDTPYNTYLHRGLPPSPINSPGLAAIRAALNPAETDYLFFVADNTGGHAFSRTNAEHNRAKRRIRSNQ